MKVTARQEIGWLCQHVTTTSPPANRLNVFSRICYWSEYWLQRIQNLWFLANNFEPDVSSCMTLTVRQQPRNRFGDVVFLVHQSHIQERDPGIACLFSLQPVPAAGLFSLNFGWTGSNGPISWQRFLRTTSRNKKIIPETHFKIWKMKIEVLTIK